MRKAARVRRRRRMCAPRVSPVMPRKMRWKWNGENPATRESAARLSSSSRWFWMCASTVSSLRRYVSCVSFTA